MAVVLHERTIRRGLFLTSALVALLGLIAELLHYLAPTLRWAILPFLSLSVESNFPTWYSSGLLAGCALLLILIAVGVRQSGAAFFRHWLALGLVFLYMSLDEAIELHENLGQLVELHGVLFFSWVVPAGVLVLFIGLAYLSFLKHLPRQARLRFIAAGLLYVGGALGVELPLGYWAERAGRENLVYALIDWVEETMEIFGATLFFVSLLAYLRQHFGELRLSAPEEP